MISIPRPTAVGQSSMPRPRRPTAFRSSKRNRSVYHAEEVSSGKSEGLEPVMNASRTEAA